MKKTAKKLVLAKETLRSLEAQELERAAGGFLSLQDPCNTSNGPIRCLCPK